MNIRVAAIANIGTFVAADADENCCVITLDDTKVVEIGDVLSGTFDGQDSLFYTVQNLTQRQLVRICLEHWECDLPGAVQALLDFKGVQTVVAGSKQFVASSHDAVSQIVREVRGS